MKNKKGAMELSINTIVILFLALAMLGVGMFIINKMREQVSGFDSFSGNLEKEMIEKLEASSKRLELQYKTLEVKNSGKEQVLFGVKNELDNDQVFDVNITCPVKLGDTDVENNKFITKEISYTPKISKLELGKAKVTSFFIAPTASREKTNYECIITISYDLDGQSVKYAEEWIYVKVI